MTLKQKLTTVFTQPRIHSFAQPFTVSPLALVLVQTVVESLKDLKLVAQVRPREEVVLQLVPYLGQCPPLWTAGRGMGVVGLFEGVFILVVVAHKTILVVEVIAFGEMGPKTMVS